ncbi:MAG: hypothetical protein J0L63_12360 [Anaerolineae bacterium]|nr:hypothetical protein [Anaerolineae bacterium]
MRREEGDAAAGGAFVVVVVVVTDKECGTPSGTSCRLPRMQGRQNTGESGADKIRSSSLERLLLPISEGEVAGLAALAAVTLAFCGQFFLQQQRRRRGGKWGGKPPPALRATRQPHKALHAVNGGGKRQVAWTRPPQTPHAGMIGTACRCGREWRPYGGRRWAGMRLLRCAASC